MISADSRADVTPYRQKTRGEVRLHLQTDLLVSPFSCTKTIASRHALVNMLALLTTACSNANSAQEALNLTVRA